MSDFSFAMHENKGDVVLTTGLGLSDQGVPLRLPSLLIPGLEALTALHAKGAQGRYVVYQAGDFIIEANKLDGLTARANAVTMKTYLGRFVQAFYPHVAASVDFRFGKDCVVANDDLAKIEQDLGVLEKKTSPASEELQGAFDLIRAYGERHAGANSCLRYAAANVLLNGGFAGSYPLAQHETTAQTTLVPLGGKREAPFFALTCAMASHTGCLHQVKPALVETGKMPTYYPCPDGDLLLGESADGFKIPRRLRDDFKALDKIGASIPALQSLMRPEKVRAAALKDEECAA